MPNYDFACPKCENEEPDILMSISDYTKKGFYCPECNTKMEQILGPLRFSLRGSGWARDGYEKFNQFEHETAKKEYDAHQKKSDRLHNKESIREI